MNTHTNNRNDTTPLKVDVEKCSAGAAVSSYAAPKSVLIRVQASTPPHQIQHQANRGENTSNDPNHH